MGRKETLFVLITFLGLAFLVHGGSSRSFVTSQENDLDSAEQTKAKTNGIVKIVQMDRPYLISCVDVYKQPAFKHPLLANHKLQWAPTTYPSIVSDEAPVEQMKSSFSVSENDVCPENTIPILLPKQSPTANKTRRYEFAILKMNHYPDDMFYGASALININTPSCKKGQSSGASIWLGSDLSDQKNFIKAGWMVYPDVYGDSRPRLSIYWTGDGFHKTGCYDLLCPGFIQINSGIALGVPLARVTMHGSDYSQKLNITIFQDATTKDWWLSVGNNFGSTLMGYWPKELFPRLGRGGTVLRFGGSVMTEGLTFPEMGDGYIPDGDWRHSNFFRRIHYVNKTNYFVPPRSFGTKTYSDNPRCYRLMYVEKEEQDFGSSLYMGGPGGYC